MISQVLKNISIIFKLQFARKFAETFTRIFYSSENCNTKLFGQMRLRLQIKKNRKKLHLCEAGLVVLKIIIEHI